MIFPADRGVTRVCQVLRYLFIGDVIECASFPFRKFDHNAHIHLSGNRWSELFSEFHLKVFLTIYDSAISALDLHTGVQPSGTRPCNIIGYELQVRVSDDLVKEDPFV